MPGSVPAPAPKPEPGLRTGWALPAVLVMAVLPYLNAIPNGFVLDDELIEKDPRIHAFEVGRILRTGYWDTINQNSSSDVYRPLAVLSYAANFRLAGRRPAVFHAVNVMLHAVTSALVLALVVRLLGDAWLAFAAASLFATHPLHTEAVTSIVGRAEIQAALFLLAALYLHVRRYAIAGLPPRAWVGIGVVCFGLGLLSKETAVAGPVALLLVGMLDPRDGPRAGLRRATPVALLYLVVVGLYLAARTAVLGTPTVGSNSQTGLLHGESLPVRILTGLDILVVYAKLLVWPVSLSADYSYRQIPIARSLGAVELGGLALTIALAAGFVWAVRRRHRPLAFAIGSFAAPYAVVSNVLVPIGVLVAERLMYLPSLGFCVGAASMGVVLARSATTRAGAAWPRAAMAGVLALVVGLYAVRTWVRNRDWVDERTLYAATVRTAPDSAQAHYRYGTRLIDHEDAASLLAGRDEFLRTLEIRPNHLAASINLTHTYLQLGDAVRAAETARRGLEHHPGHRRLRNMLGQAEGQLNAVRSTR